MRRVLIQFEPEMLARLQFIADRAGMSLAAVVRLIIQERFDSNDRKADEKQ
jgi:hypothetical protein